MSEYYKRIENIECVSTHRYYAYDALQWLLLPVGDWYKQCGCVGAGPSIAAAKQVENKER